MHIGVCIKYTPPIRHAVFESTERSLTCWDRLGLLFSGVCVVHCLWMPVLLAAVPLWPEALHAHAWAHPVLALLLLPVTALALYGALRRGARAMVPLLFVLGLGLVLAAFGLHDWIGDAGEAALTLTGSGALIGGHVLNHRGRMRRPLCCVA